MAFTLGTVGARGQFHRVGGTAAGSGSGTRAPLPSFAATFGFITLLVLGSMAALAFLLTRLAGGDGHIAGLVWVGGCGLSLALPILALGLAVRAFRRIATPLAEVMSAADTVANGDLSVRVPVHGPGDFQRLADHSTG